MNEQANDPGARSDERHHDAYESVCELLHRVGEYDENGNVAKDYQALIASHALITTLETCAERIANILEGIAENTTSLDFNANFSGNQLETIGEALNTLRGAVGEIAESVDFMAARPDGGVVPTASESERMLGILKVDWLRQHPEHAEEEYCEAMRRFEILAGL